MMTDKRTKQRHTLHWLVRIAGRLIWYVAALVMVQCLLGSIGVFFAILFRNLIDSATAGNLAVFRAESLRLCGLIVVQLALRALLRFLKEWTHSTMENRFKARLFSCLMAAEYAPVRAIHTGEWMNRLTSDTVVVADGITQIVPGLGELAVRLLGALAAITALEPIFAAILLPCGILLLALTYFFRKILKRLHRQVQESDGSLRVLLQERLESLLIVRSFGAEAQSVSAVESAMGRHRQMRMRRSAFSNFCNVGFGAAMWGLYAFGAIYCGWNLLSGSISYGTMTAVLQLIGQIQTPFANITGYLPHFYSMLASAERLMEAERFWNDDKKPLPVEEVFRYYENDLRAFGLRDAVFAYRSTRENMTRGPLRVLTKMQLSVNKGDFVAFTGPSGCGKSTVLKLLMCIYPLDSGERFLLSDSGEQPLSSAWRGLFAYVPQGNQLLQGTIREIVSFGAPENAAEDERLWEALTIACANDFVRSLDAGLDTRLGEHGAGLSEGQIQRLAVARALFSRRPILLLDECTSALDESTEALLLRNLRAMTDRTVLIVTHRCAALEICDRKYRFSQGEVEEF